MKVLDKQNWAYRVVVVDLNKSESVIDKGFVSYEQAESFFGSLSKASFQMPVCVIILNAHLKTLKHQVKAANR